MWSHRQFFVQDQGRRLSHDSQVLFVHIRAMKLNVSSLLLRFLLGSDAKRAEGLACDRQELLWIQSPSIRSNEFSVNFYLCLDKVIITDG